MEEFLELRKWFFGELDKILKSPCGEYHKSYEGTFEVNFWFPNIFEPNISPEVSITLDCYVVGPHRHYRWVGKNIEDAIKLCRADLEEWLKEALEDN